MPEFTKYPHLERIGNTEVEGIVIGETYVFPKLDGTNASVWLDGKGEVCAGSRNRKLSLEKDNAGFYAWVKENEQGFKYFFNYHPNFILYGEWLVPHSLKTYREEAWRKFYIFDVALIKAEGVEFLHYDEYMPLLEFMFPWLEAVPCIGKVKHGSKDDYLKFVQQNTYLIQEGKGIGEGVVIKNYGFRNKFGRSTWAKMVSNEFKEEHVKTMGVGTLERKHVEEEIVNKYVTDALVDKVYSKIVTEEGGWSSKFIPRLLETVWYDLIREEMWSILKDFKLVKIDFKLMKTLTVMKVKEKKSDLF